MFRIYSGFLCFSQVDRATDDLKSTNVRLKETLHRVIERNLIHKNVSILHASFLRLFLSDIMVPIMQLSQFYHR